MLPQAVKRYLLPLQSKYAKWYDETVRQMTQNYAFCTLCKQKESNLQRHYMQHHARWRSIWFCPIPGCPSSLFSKEGLVRHLMSRQHARGIELNLGRRVAKPIRTVSGLLPKLWLTSCCALPRGLFDTLRCILWQEWPWNQDYSAFTPEPETHRS